jgi:hypothetical protein
MKLITAVVHSAPKFNGSSVFAYWKNALCQHLALSGVVEGAEKLRVAKLCLEGSARDYIFAS